MFVSLFTDAYICWQCHRFLNAEHYIPLSGQSVPNSSKAQPCTGCNQLPVFFRSSVVVNNINLFPLRGSLLPWSHSSLSIFLKKWIKQRRKGETCVGGASWFRYSDGWWCLWGVGRNAAFSQPTYRTKARLMRVITRLFHYRESVIILQSSKWLHRFKPVTIGFTAEEGLTLQ